MEIKLKTFSVTENTPGAPEKAKKENWHGASYRCASCLLIRYGETEKEAMYSLLVAVSELYKPLYNLSD